MKKGRSNFPLWGPQADNYFERRSKSIFKAGINCDGYFSAENLQQQVDHAIDIFEGKSKGLAQGLILFDNAPSHQKQAADALYQQE